MIIWVNGAFGAGKSTLAGGLREALSGSVIADPEDVGALLRQSMAGHPRRVRDYQEYPAWRRLTTRLVAELHELAAGPVIVPMAVLNPAYAAEMFGPLSELGTPFYHVVLHAGPDRLEARIAASCEYPGEEERSEAVRSHRRRRAADYSQASAAWLHAAASHVIDTSHVTPGQTLHTVLAHLPVFP
ncbi:AAA family ATPase [Streptomyces sp. NPDC058525]|uniref:AAA family ATPase n=1 Tax=Streptomyces sp. NPDC058525 TaxID=3346538 RepID=UPI00364F86BA